MSKTWHEWVGTSCVWCGLTRGRYARAYDNTGEGPACERPSAMSCGHPLAARRVRWTEDTIPAALVTDCWACAVQRELVSKIVGPKAKAKRDAA